MNKAVCVVVVDHASFPMVVCVGGVSAAPLLRVHRGALVPRHYLPRGQAGTGLINLSFYAYNISPTKPG